MILGLFTNPSHDFGVGLRKGGGGGGGSRGKVKEISRPNFLLLTFGKFATQASR